MAASQPSDIAYRRRRLTKLKHPETVQLGITNVNARMAPHNPSVKFGGEGDTSGEYPVELIDDVEEDEESLMHSLPSSSSSNTSGKGGEADEKANVLASASIASAIVNASGSANSVGGNRRKTSFDNADDLGRRPPRRTQRKDKPVVDDSSSRWFGYDLSIVVALISPIGNMLTGGDHVKNILLLLLLIYYLHQLIEVPWTLYKESIPRRELGDKPAPDEEPQADERSHSAYTELRSYEFMYLALTVLSPFLGAMLLRIVATAITGDAKTLSWFSTSLFVLATGIRPWAHLVERLKSRSRALNDILKEMDDEEGKAGHGQSEDDISELREYVHSLDERLLRLSDRGSADAKELYEHLQGVCEGVDKTLRRHRAELVKSTQSQNARVAVLEARLNGLDLAVEKSFLEDGREHATFAPARELWQRLVHTTWSAWVYALHASGLVRYTPSRGSGRNLKLMGPSGSPLSRRSSTHLEPIAEEDNPLVSQPGPSDASREGMIIGDEPIRMNGTLSRRTKRKVSSGHWIKRSFSAMIRLLLSPFTMAYRALSFVFSVPGYFIRAVFS